MVVRLTSKRKEVIDMSEEFSVLKSDVDNTGHVKGTEYQIVNMNLWYNDQKIADAADFSETKEFYNWKVGK